MGARVWIFALSCLVVTLATREGHTGTYGGVDGEYEGFRVYIDASVGSLADPSLEAQELEDNRTRARADLAAVEPTLLAMYRHYTAGTHPYMESRRRLDRARRAPGPSGPESPLALRITRPMGDDLMGGGLIDVRVMLYVQPDLSPAALDKIASDFVACQLSPGGALADTASGEWRTVELARSQLADALRVVSGGPAGRMSYLLDFARTHERAVQALITVGDPLATVLGAVGHGKPLEGDLYDRLTAVAPDRVALVIRVMALLAPDASRADRIDRLRRWHRQHPSDDETLDAWLAELAR